MLQSQLYGSASDLCKKNSSEEIQSDAGVEAAIRTVYKHDPLAVVNDLCSIFLKVLNTKRGTNETFKNFESRFKAQVSKLNSL